MENVKPKVGANQGGGRQETQGTGNPTQKRSKANPWDKGEGKAQEFEYIPSIEGNQPRAGQVRRFQERLSQENKPDKTLIRLNILREICTTGA